MVLVVPFELVFVRQESEQYDCLLQRDIDFVLCFLYVSSISLVTTELLTAFVPFFKCSSMNRDRNSGARGLALMNDWKA